MTYNEVKIKYNLMGYKFRTEKMGLNFFGIRTKTSKSDKFDDLGGVAWMDDFGPQIFNFWMTTDPGKHWLLSPMNKNGTIIMVPGQYIECYEKGLHAGKYDAFKQCKKMAYVRDNNRDTTLDFDLYRDPAKRKVSLFWDICGTNLHRAHKNVITEFVGQYSAGCQVVQRGTTFDKLLALRDLSMEKGFTKWDYTLFDQ